MTFFSTFVFKFFDHEDTDLNHFVSFWLLASRCFTAFPVIYWSVLPDSGYHIGASPQQGCIIGRVKPAIEPLFRVIGAPGIPGSMIEVFK